ncbi:MAG: 16S rRNA (guanine(966)-N(2))-methyltransferase RsmD [Dehalococcoidia bacterium]
MRIIAGEAKGKRLKSPRHSSTRPSSELARGAIFSILESMNIPCSRILDLYSGTGALGIEALSRGAQWADFVERDTACCSIIKENIKNLEMQNRSHVYTAEVKRAMSFLKNGYDVIFMDPPYNEPFVDETLERLTTSPLVGPEATIVVEHSRHQTLRAHYNDFQRIKERKYGDTVISIYRKGVND